MKNTFSSLSLHSRRVASLVYASVQLSGLFLLLLIEALRNDWRSLTNSQSSPPMDHTPDPDDLNDWMQDELSDEEVRDIWLSMLDEPYVQTNCQHHLTRCLKLAPALKDSNIS